MRILQSFLLVIIFMATSVQLFAADKKGDIAIDTEINLGNGMKITKIIHPLPDFDPKAPVETQTMTKSTYDYPSIPLAGFTPYVAVMTSNRAYNQANELEHVMEYSYRGRPLKYNSGTTPFTIGVLDSGSVTDLVAGSAVDELGITEEWITESTASLGGAGEGQIDAYVSYPMGIFAAGLGAINTDTMIVDPNEIMGHSNTTILVAPPITCQNQEVVSALVGNPLMSFMTSNIRNDKPQKVTINSKTYIGPDIKFSSPNIGPSFPHTREISLELNSELPLSTAAWYSSELDDNLNFIPNSATTLSIFAGTPALQNYYYLINVDLSHDGEERSVKLMFDTGAQSSIISEAVANSLSLPLTGDFEVEICGVAGSTQNVPGFYIEQVGISAGGGKLRFSHVPIIKMNLTGSGVDGIVGTNFFYNRNIAIKPEPSALTALVYVSDPVDFAHTDFNENGLVDMGDFALFSSSWLSEFGQANYNIQHDLFLSDSVDMEDLQIFVGSWLKEN